MMAELPRENSFPMGAYERGKKGKETKTKQKKTVINVRGNLNLRNGPSPWTIQ